MHRRAPWRPSWRASGRAAALVVTVAVLALLLLRRRDEGPATDPPPSPSADATAPAGTGGPTSLAPSPRGPAAAEATTTRPILGRPRPVPEGPVIRGVVVDPAGAPVVGARVVAFPDTATEFFAVEVGGGAEGGGGAGTRSENFTDPDGRFVVEAGGDAPFFGLVVHAVGFALGGRSAVRVGADVRIVLDAGLRVRGRVLTMDGEPIAGATVTAMATEGLARIERTTTSGEDGGYALEGLPRSPAAFGTFAALRATKEGYAVQRIRGLGRPVRGVREELVADLVLVRGATVVGTVVDDETGRPVEGAEVVAWMSAGAEGNRHLSGATWMNPFVDEALGTTTSAADGSFRLANVPANGFHRIESSNAGLRGRVMGYVSAGKPGFTWGTDDLPVVEDGATIETTLRLRPSASVVGRVVDATGGPVAGARVHAFRKGAEGGSAICPPHVKAAGGTSSARADADGVYVLRIVPATTSGPSSLSVTARDAATSDGSSPATATISVDVEAGQAVRAHDLVLAGGAGADPLAGRVVIVVRDAAGAPVAGATVASMGAFLFDARGGGRTGRDGRLVVRPPPRGRDPGPPTVRVKAPGYAPASLTLPPDATEVEVTLGPGQRIAGKVVTADGAPAPGMRLAAYEATAPLPELTGAWRMNAAAIATSDDAGRFELDDLAPGPHHLVAFPTAVRTTGPAPATLESVPEGATDVLLTLPAGPARPVGRIAVRVVDAETGRPLGSASLSCSPVGPDTAPAPTAYRAERARFAPVSPAPSVVPRSPGEFETEGGEPGTYDLRVTAPGYVEARVPGVVLGPTDVEVAPVRLSRGVRLHGRVTLPEGESAKDKALILTRTDDERATTAVPLAADGRFDASGFRPGAHHIRVGPAGFSLDGRGHFLPEDDELVHVPEGRAAFEVERTTVRAGTLAVELRDPRLPGPRWMGGSDATAEQTAFGKASSLALRREDGTPVRSASSLEDGLPRDLSHLVLRPATYVLRLELPGGERQERTVVVAAGAAARVALGAGAPAR